MMITAFLPAMILLGLVSGPEFVETLDGKRLELKAPRGGALAIIFYSSECPISNELSPRVVEVAKAFPADRVRMIGVAVDYDRARADLIEHRREHGLNYPCAVDLTGAIVKKYGATMTPEAVVVDDQGTIRYRGRINDLYSTRGKRNANPSTHEFRDAVELVLDKKPVPSPWPRAVGCPVPSYPTQ